jgi:hypothetical protein
MAILCSANIDRPPRADRRDYNDATLTAALELTGADLAMKETTDLNRSDEDIVACHIPDEALEAAASADIGPAVTWGCTNVWWCGAGGGSGPSRRLQG